MLKKLIDKLKGSSCEEDIEHLTQENEILRQKLVEKQEHINKTNAYYKKKIHLLKKKG